MEQRLNCYQAISPLRMIRQYRFVPRTGGGLLLLVKLILAAAGAMMSSPSSNPCMVEAWSVSSSSRRLFVSSLVGDFAVISALRIERANALDMDAFIQNELSNERCDDRVSKKCQPKLTDDEALCRFGQPSLATGEACVRAKMSPKRSTGVDAFGKVDRGEYLRCKAKYVDDATTNKLVKQWECK